MVKAERTFDYIVVGGGASGCVVANRLSADPDVSVLLLEVAQVALLVVIGTVDISGLAAVGDVLRVSDLAPGPNVTVIDDPEEVVVKIAPRRELVVEDEEVAPAEGEAEEGAAAEAAEGEAQAAAAGGEAES